MTWYVPYHCIQVQMHGNKLTVRSQRSFHGCLIGYCFALYPVSKKKKRRTITWTSQSPGRAVTVGRSSKRSFHDPLIGLVPGA